jgi:hypothetical protein
MSKSISLSPSAFAKALHHMLTNAFLCVGNVIWSKKGLMELKRFCLKQRHDFARDIAGLLEGRQQDAARVGFGALDLFGVERELLFFDEGVAIELGKDFKAGELVEPLGGFGGSAIAVLHFGPDFVDLFEREGFAQALVELHTEGDLFDIAFGEAGIGGDLDLHIADLLGQFALESLDGAFQHLAVEMKTNAGHVARLFESPTVRSYPSKRKRVKGNIWALFINFSG